MPVPMQLAMRGGRARRQCSSPGPDWRAGIATGGSMSDVTERIRGSLSSGRESVQLPPGQALLGAVLHNIILARVLPGVGASTLGIEPSIDNKGVLNGDLDDEWATAVLFVGSTTEYNSDPRFRCLPLPEHSILIVDAESRRVLGTLPFMPKMGL